MQALKNIFLSPILEHELSEFSIYIHFPYCLQKCPYCDFNSYAIRKEEHDFKRYTRAVLAELKARMHLFSNYTLRSIYLGGGTPSLWSSDAIAQIIDLIIQQYPYRLSPLEITLEANPGAVELSSLAGFKSAGVNRISMGIQSLDNKLLKVLGRIHNQQEAKDALDKIKQTNFKSYSVDFIYAIPSQTLQDWKYTLDAIDALQLPHVSAYNLIYEENTPLFDWRAHRKIIPHDEDTEAEFYELTVRSLQAACLQQYEVSNFARTGHQSVHNQTYWNGQSYLGIGAGAHGFLLGHVQSHSNAPSLWAERYENIRTPQAYESYWLNEMPSSLALQSIDTQPLATNMLAEEQVLLGLRCQKGWNAAMTADLCGVDAISVAQQIADRYPEWCAYEKTYLRPTQQGLMVSQFLVSTCALALEKQQSIPKST